MGVELTSAQKAAVLVMTLDDDKAAELLKHMSESSLAKLRQATEGLDVSKVAEEQKRDALRGFFLKQRRGGLFLGDPHERFRRVLAMAKGEEGVARLYAAVPEVERSPREFLDEVSEEQIARVLARESPRCAAVLLSSLSGEKAGGILNMLEQELREAIVERIVSNEDVPAEVSEQIIVGFKQRLEEMGTGVEAPSEERRAQELAGMLAKLGKESQEHVLTQMHERDPDMAEQLERLMFSFGDLPKVSDRSMQELLRNVEVTQVAMALKGASEQMREHFYTNMSQRLRERVEEEREMTGRVPLSQVEEAREQIMTLARKRYREGELVVEIGDEQYVE